MKSRFLLMVILVLAAMPLAAQDAPTECADGFWLFEHERLAHGAVCVPDDPQRIVALDMPATEFALLNDVPLIAVYGYVADEISAISPGLAAKMDGLPRLDWAPNLEVVTELNPDLIIAFKDSSLFYEGMEAIAPVVVYDAAFFTDWKSSTAFWAEVFGKTEAFDEMLATYDARVAELAEALGEDRGDIEVSLYYPNVDFPMIFLVDSAQGVILQDVGLGRPAGQAVTFDEGGYTQGGADYGWVQLSAERVDLADGDEIFMFAYPTTDPDQHAVLEESIIDYNDNNPLWQALTANKKDHVHIVGPHWFRAQTYLAANLILDDLFATLTDVEPQIASPAAEYLAAPAAEE